MPVVIRTIVLRIELNDAGWFACIYMVEEHELSRRAVFGKDTEIGAISGEGRTKWKSPSLSGCVKPGCGIVQRSSTPERHQLGLQAAASVRSHLVAGRSAITLTHLNKTAPISAI